MRNFRGEARLEQVEAGEGGQREEPLADEDGAAVVAQGQRQHDDKTGHDADETFDGHFRLLE